MKKLTLFAVLSTLVLASCTENKFDTTVDTETLPDLTAEFADGETKTYVDNNKYLRWHEADLITAFYGNALNRQYKFNGITGDNSGTFSLVPSGELGTGNTLGAIYAVYPYDAGATITDEGTISLTLPATQTYAENSFGRGANTMIAVTENIEDTFLGFKNACGYLKLKLYNAEGVRVKSIEVKGNNEEKIAGAATAIIEFGSAPELAMGEDATTTVTLDCGEQGVALGTTAETATEFWIVLPEVTFEGGITISVTDELGGVFTQETNNKVAIIRNNIQPMAALNADVFEGSIPNNHIWYTATEKVEISTTSINGKNIVANDWDETTHKGIIQVDGIIEHIGTIFRDTNITSITLPNSLVSIESNAFYGCSGLESIVIPNSVSSIGNSAFYGCSSLKSIVIPNSVTSVGTYAFGHCSFTTLPELPRSIIAWPNGLFAYCGGLTNVVIPDHIVSLGEYVFRDCSNLTSIYMPSTITEIGQYAFANCTSLATVNIPNGSITSLTKYTFSGCTALTELMIGEGVRYIQSNVCDKCTNLSILTLPSTTLEIDKNAFSSCSALKTIYCKATQAPKIYCYPNSNSYSLPWPSASRKIYIPRGANYYQTSMSSSSGLEARNWMHYKDNIVEYDYIYN